MSRRDAGASSASDDTKDFRNLSSSQIHAKCQKAYQLVSKRKKKIRLEDTGSPPTNLLLEFLTCQSKATKTCTDVKKAYEVCHKAVMGVGSFQGKRHCGDEMKAFLVCVTTATNI